MPLAEALQMDRARGGQGDVLDDLDLLDGRDGDDASGPSQTPSQKDTLELLGRQRGPTVTSAPSCASTAASSAPPVSPCSRPSIFDKMQAQRVIQEDASSKSDHGGNNMAKLSDKICVGCNCSAMTPSPLCMGCTRTGDYPDWSSNWCKHCAAMARLRFADSLGGSLGAVETWINKSEQNAIFFRIRVIAYYTLKLDPNLQRVTFAALESRVTVLEAFLEWNRRGDGIPHVPHFGPKMVVDISDASKLSTNLLLHGGVVQEMWSIGKVVLGVALSGDEANRMRSGVPSVLEMTGLSVETSPAIADVMAGGDLRCESEEHTKAFAWMAKEYIEMANARERAGAQPPLGTPSSPSASDALMKWSPAGELLSTPGKHRPRSEPESDGDHPRDLGLGSAFKRRRMAGTLLKEEVDEKMNVLTTEGWMTLCCDKSVDGLLTRITNSRQKMLDNNDPEAAAPLSSLLDSVNAMSEFGTAHKKGYMKTAKDGNLQVLIEPLRKLKEVVGSKQKNWHFTLKRLVALIDFTEEMAEGRVAEALSSMTLEKVTQHFDDEDSTVGH